MLPSLSDFLILIFYNFTESVEEHLCYQKEILIKCNFSSFSIEYSQVTGENIKSKHYVELCILGHLPKDVIKGSIWSNYSKKQNAILATYYFCEKVGLSYNPHFGSFGLDEKFVNRS